jgi:hypothetical protein
MKWMGILFPDQATIVVGNLLDTLCARLEKLMSFAPGERDLVMLQHKFVVEWSDGNTAFGFHVFALLTHVNFTCRRLSHPPLSSLAIPVDILPWPYQLELLVESPLGC